MNIFLITIICLCQIFCCSITSYFWAAHEDLDRSLIEPMDLTTQMSDYHPIEIYAHIFVTFLGLFSAHWTLFLMNLPLVLYNLKMIKEDKHKFHCFTYKEYKAGGKRDKMEKLFKYKMIFHLVLCFVMIWMLMSHAMFLLQFFPLMDLLRSTKLGRNLNYFEGIFE